VNIVLKVFAVLLALCMILPGLCTLFFGGSFALSALSGSQEMYGFSNLAIPWLLIGGLVTWFGIMILIWTFRRRD
jgi:hypothetical protein